MVKRYALTDFIYAAVFAALTAVLGAISIPIPFSPVPVSGQSLGIMLTGSILSAKQAALSVLTFLLLGAVGIPVFGGLTGGIGVLVGPKGGYLTGFFAGVIIIALVKGSTDKLWRLALANVVGGICVVYIPGVLWLSFVTGVDLNKAIMIGALPFIPGDLFKVFVAAVIGTAVNKHFLRTVAR
ncbi:MAG: BioY protein [Firmicutes bacterium]|nr:BioY protein [Bacillota bacterium]